MEMTPLSWILTFILGGTNVWTVVMYVLERKKRALENKSAQTDIDDKEFETLKKQLEYQDIRLNNYEQKMREKETLDDEMRSQMVELKRGKYEAELLVMKLTQKLNENETKYSRDACMVQNCPQRISPKTNQQQQI